MVAHLLLLCLLLFFRVPETPPPGATPVMEMVAMPTSTSRSPTAHPVTQPHPTPQPPRVETPPPATVPAPVPRPAPQPVVATPTPPVAIAPPPNPAPSSFVVPPVATSKPAVKPVKTSTPSIPTTPTPKPAKEKPAHKIEVNLNLTDRPSNPTKSATHPLVHPTKDAAPSESAPAIDSNEIASKLAQELNNSGSTQSIGKVAVSSSSGSPGQFAEFYQLIRKQMYDAWVPPPELVGFKKGTEVQIQVAADGTILDAKVTVSSGNSRFDACALSAALKVGKLREPRPEGCPEFITVNFRLT